MKNGYGIEIKKDNHNYVYRGCFINGKKEGIGIAKLNNGSIYEGFWKNDKKDGFGIYYFPPDKFYIGFWTRGWSYKCILFVKIYKIKFGVSD